MNNLLVMKFGGTSVGSAERMKAAARISAEQKKERPVVVVVSAMSKVTDLLLETMRRAEAGDAAGMEANIAQLRERHVAACCELLPAERRDTVLAGLHGLIAEFDRITRGMCSCSTTGRRARPTKRWPSGSGSPPCWWRST